MFNKALNRMLSLLILGTFILSLTFTAGCGQNQDAANVSSPKQKADTRTVVDQAGREVILPLEINRIATTWRPCTFLIYAIGAQSKLAGVDDGSTKTPFTTGVYPQIADIPHIGDKRHGINMEELIAVKPDVVCVWSGKGSDSIVKQLETQGIPTLVIIPESAEQMKEAALLLGDILDCSKQAKEILRYYDELAEKVNKSLKEIPDAERKKVYLAGAQGILSSCGSDFYQHYLIEKAGGINVAAELKGGWQSVSPEQLIAWNPDVIIADPYCKEGMDDILKVNPGLKGINAIKNNELYSFPSIGQWTFPIPQSAMGILWLSKIMYPEQFEGLDLQKEVDNYYQNFFGKSYTEIGGSNLDGKGIHKKIKKKSKS